MGVGACCGSHGEEVGRAGLATAAPSSQKFQGTLGDAPAAAVLGSAPCQPGLTGDHLERRVGLEGRRGNAGCVGS